MFRSKLRNALVTAGIASLGLGGVAVAQQQPGQQPEQPEPQQEQPGQQPEQPEQPEPQQEQPGQQPERPEQQPGQQPERPEQQPEAQRPGQQQQQQQQQRLATRALAQLHAINQVATGLGALGVNRAQNQEVVDFAQRIVEEHQQADLELMQFARDNELDVAGSRQAMMARRRMMQQVQPQIRRLQQAEGQQFDQRYLQLVAQTKERAMQRLEQTRGQLQDERVRQVLDERLNTLQQQQREAQQLQQQIGQQQPQQQQP